MKSDVKDKAIVLDAEPHDIMDIPAASLWELCRSFDAEAGVQLRGGFSGLRLFRHFVSLTKTRRHKMAKKEFFMFTPEVPGRWESRLLLSQKLSADPSKRRCSMTSGGVWFNAP